ncbi:MAG: multidrug efflux SMR transporter, partial [Archaeoglobaceae archaeon]|nr:multidrug efflux SMR transporter [Archaeoglobaceae archaeon]MDW8118934.1 multidrug efflux SMR transporter [Archaeoglobaceae archaeon]
TSMKLSYGFTKLLPTLGVLIFYGISFTFLGLALKKIDLSIAYAIWSGVGTALIAFIGLIVLKEPISVLKLISLLLVIIGVIGLRLSGVD